MTLSHLGVTTSALGYGCASLMGRTGRAESVRLLEEAFEAGIAHYDVARSYGYGEAESAVGAFIVGRRDEVTVTTKLGIDPPRPSRRLALAKVAVRRAGALVTPLRRAARRRGERMQATGRFGVAEARASLETSLRELGTDYVDVLLLHECRAEDLSGELLSFLRERVEQGSVRSFGIATDPAATRAALTGGLDPAQVVQVANSLTSPTVDGMPELEGRAVITHSPLQGGLDQLYGHVAASPERSERWSHVVGADCSDRLVLGELMLAWAARSNPHGIVLFSSRDPAKIRANAALVDRPDRREQAERLGTLVQEEMMPASNGET